MSRLARDGTAEPVSRDQNLRRVRGQGNIYFPCSADYEQDWQPYPVDPYSAICDGHTYIWYSVRPNSNLSLSPTTLRDVATLRFENSATIPRGPVQAYEPGRCPHWDRPHVGRRGATPRVRRLRRDSLCREGVTWHGGLADGKALRHYRQREGKGNSNVVLPLQKRQCSLLVDDRPLFRIPNEPVRGFC